MNAKPHQLQDKTSTRNSASLDAQSWPAADEYGDPRFRLAFDNAPIGIAIVGMDSRFQRVNKALCKVLGYSEEELLSLRVTDIAHPDDGRLERDVLEKLIKGEIPSYRTDKRYIAKDGRLVWLDLTVVLIRGTDSQILCGLCMVDDITQTRQAHEALRTSEERYRSFVVNSSEGIWRIEIEKPIETNLPTEEQIALFYKHGYLAECNDALARMYGKNRAEDIVGKRFGDFAMASNPTNVSCLRSFIKNGYRLKHEETVDPDVEGRMRLYSTSMIGTVVNGVLLRVWGTQHDETERRQSEEELKSSRQLLRSLAAYLQTMREKERSAIAREMHDVIGQSLVGIKMDLAWVRKHLSQASDATVLAETEERLEAANGLLEEAIGSVKTISTELRPGVLDKFGLAAAVEWQCQEFQRRTGIKSKCSFPSQPLQLSPERSTAVFRILQEALTNIAQHSHANNVSIELRVDDQELTLTVRDDGDGISQEELQDPRSLGLLGMRERSESLGGSLTIEGTPEGGTLLVARVPLKNPQAIATSGTVR
jgi:PAS domain S-box-containing protein